MLKLVEGSLFSAEEKRKFWVGDQSGILLSMGTTKSSFQLLLDQKEAFPKLLSLFLRKLKCSLFSLCWKYYYEQQDAPKELPVAHSNLIDAQEIFWRLQSLKTSILPPNE